MAVELTAAQKDFLKSLSLTKASAMQYYQLLLDNNEGGTPGELLPEVERRIRPLYKAGVFSGKAKHFRTANAPKDLIHTWKLAKIHGPKHALLRGHREIFEEKVGFKVLNQFLEIVDLFDAKKSTGLSFELHQIRELQAELTKVKAERDHWKRRFLALTNSVRVYSTYLEKAKGAWSEIMYDAEEAKEG